MSFNLLPFLFAPGLAGIGYMLGGLAGAAAALVGWTAIVVAATACVMIVRALRRPGTGYTEEDAGRAGN